MISVCIPTYNGAKYLREQLDSILLQLGKEDEVIISDDSSTDATLQILKNFHDPRIRILHREGGVKHPSFNLENALKQAKGDYIFTADQDDIWMENKVEKMVQALQEYDLVVSDAMIVAKNGQMIAESFFQQHHSKRGYWANLLRNSFLGCCMAFRRECLSYILPFPSKIAMHDIWIGLCVELHGKTLFLPEKLIRYRRHEQNASSAGEKSRLTMNARIRYRLYFLTQTMIRRYLIF